MAATLQEAAMAAGSVESCHSEGLAEMHESCESNKDERSTGGTVSHGSSGGGGGGDHESMQHDMSKHAPVCMAAGFSSAIIKK